MVLDTSQIIAPREDYQRELKSERVKRIVKSFDERIANEPKVSFRDGKYYVFDGQHTIDARKVMNGGKDLPVLCKVYMGLDEKEEAMLFAKQTGESARLTPGIRVRAEISQRMAMRQRFSMPTPTLELSWITTRKEVSCVLAVSRRHLTPIGRLARNDIKKR